MTDPRSPADARLRATWCELHRHADDLRECVGLPRLGVPAGPETPLLGDRYLLPSVPELAGDIESFPPPVRLVGNCTWDPGYDDQGVTDWLAASDPSAPLFYVQHGRVFGHPSFLPALLEAATGMNVRLMIDAGRLDAQPQDVPANAYLAPHVPAHQVMPRATAAICNGNTSVTMAALAYGLPLLLFPLFNEQFDMARCCALAGAGIRRSAKRVDAAAMRDLLKGLITDHALRERAAVLAAKLGTSEAGLTRAASVIQQL